MGAAFFFFEYPPLAVKASIAAPVDLLAFYCGGRVAAFGADPYRAEPLRSCEDHAFTEATGKSPYPYLVVPAPLPPYALTMLEPLGRLPFATARATLLTMLVAAALLIALALCALARLYPVARLYPIALCLVVFVGVLIPALKLGQITPFVVAALAASAWALRAGRVALGSLSAAFALVEPHIGLPACLALFICLPRSRPWLALCAAELVLAALLCGGFERNVEYFTRVIPAHAMAEGTSFGGQYSLAALLAQIHVPESMALTGGTISYLLMLVLGLVVAQRVFKKSNDPAFAIATAPAFVLVGGTYIHIHHMAAALPLAAIVLGTSQRRLIPALILLGLLVPWDIIEKVGLANAWFHAIPPHDAHPALAAVADGGRLAEDVWGAWVRSNANGSRPAAELFLFKLPTWLSLLALCVTTFRAGFSTKMPLHNRASSANLAGASTIS